MIERKEYIIMLRCWKDKQIIKVITGIRRCGKSMLMELFQQELLHSGIAPSQMVGREVMESVDGQFAKPC